MLEASSEELCFYLSYFYCICLKTWTSRSRNQSALLTATRTLLFNINIRNRNDISCFFGTAPFHLEITNNSAFPIQSRLVTIFSISSVHSCRSGQNTRLLPYTYYLYYYTVDRSLNPNSRIEQMPYCFLLTIARNASYSSVDMLISICGT